MMNKLYFAYGSNMDFEQMAYRCPDAEYLGVATLPNHELKMDSAGFATVVPAKGKHVQGALWDLSHVDETKMDGFEGVADNCYRKELVGVNYAGNHNEGTQLSTVFGHYEYEPCEYTLDALIYLSIRPPFVNTSWRADYVARVRNGAAAIGVDEHTQRQLDRIAVIPQTLAS